MMKPLLPLGLLLALSACAAAPAPASGDGPGPAAPPGDGIVRPDGSGPVTLKVGQVLEIALTSNASTGYQWQVVSDGAPALARTTGPATPPPLDTQPPMPGAPGIARWWFRAERPGEVTVKLEYRRPWEKEVPAAEVVQYIVRVE
ncbi:protease inhibitor I42 family protein [Pseudoxanthomonas putridarboris]|uniref:Protease inhibitor I42 family protein n=1 Tax=Pseudoxanthomonas putridarboris TaxID=752605 RepID=A0ABU9IYM4_9GAMM